MNAGRTLRDRAGALLLPLVVVLGVAAVSCSRSSPEPPVPEAETSTLLDRASAALDGGEFMEAGRILRFLASRCESGDDGRAAVLLLAAVHLDPRNPHGSPVAAARLSARYLQVPSAPPSTLGEAESLYLLALDLGAPPVDDPLAPIPAFSRDHRARRLAGGWRVASRFDGCEAGGTAVEERPLPRHPGTPLWETLERVWEERDSLARRVESLSEEADEQARTLRARADSLQSELERIRELLREGIEAPVDPS